MKLQLPPYPSYPFILGEGLSLRPILPADIKNIIDISFYDGQAADSEKIAAQMQAKIDLDYQAGNSIHWGIAHPESNLIIGTCGYYRGLDKGVGELGCILKAAYRGQGYMSKALQLAIDFGLETIKLERIIAYTDLSNEPALKLLQRLNFTKTALLEDDTVELTYSPTFLG